jgi:hypothetical protein
MRRKKGFLSHHAPIQNASAAGIIVWMLALMPIIRRYAADAYQIYMGQGRYDIMPEHAALMMARRVR